MDHDQQLFYKAMKAFQLAGLKPTTPEELAAYNAGLNIMQDIENRKPKFGGLLGKQKTKKEKIIQTALKVKEKLWDGHIRLELPEKIKEVPWEKFFKKENMEYVTYELTPTPSIRNNQAYLLGKVMANFYRKPNELRNFFKGNSFLTVKSPYRCNFRIIMKAGSVSFYLVLPKEKAGEVLRKAEGIYDTGITIKEVKNPFPKLDPSKVFCTELAYRKHDIFSLDTDRTNNYPLPSLLTAVRTLEGDDIAVFDAMFEPHNRLEWYKESRKAHNLLDSGYIPDNNVGGKILRAVHQAFNKVRLEIIDLTRITKEQKEAFEKMKKEEAGFKEAARLKAEMKNSTKRKQEDDILKTWLRVAVQSESAERARDAAYTISNAWKDISGDNELDRIDVPVKWNEKYVEAIETRKGLSVRYKANKLSVEEAGKFMQLPGDSLINEFKEISAQKTKEVSIPDELTQKGIAGIRVGYVTERGVRKLACIPLETYELEGKKIPLKAVYDAVCTAGFGQGKQGSGKSEGYGTVTAYDMVKAGFSVVIMDTADGQVLRNFINSLPADYPEEKIHALNFDNKAWAIPLDWSDIYGRDFSAADGDDELAALEISERLISRFVGYISGLKSTEDFSDRMNQYLVSCLRAITMRPGWSFHDLEMALTSPAYRQQLLERQEVKVQPDVVRDLITLQDKALSGKERSIVDPILSRLKVVASTQFVANLFYQPPKLNSDGKPVLNLRQIFDNQEGGYGHVVAVQASFDAWQELQGLILGFFDDKINFNIYSRIDIPQDQRKPILKWIDEPHKIRKYIEDRAAETAVEFRKYRAKQLYTNHAIDQMGKAADALLDGGAQITSYKTERLSELSRFAHAFKPYDDAKKLYEALPDKHVAINKVRLPSGKDCPAFIAEMVAPPSFVKDRSHVWLESSKKYGRNWKEVKETIQTKRSLYQRLDEEWLAVAEEAEREKAALEKQLKKVASEKIQNLN
jgi:hypothetical protein